MPEITPLETYEAQSKAARSHAYATGFGAVLSAHGADMTKAASAIKPRMEVAIAQQEKRASAVAGIMDIVSTLRKPAQA